LRKIDIGKAAQALSPGGSSVAGKAFLLTPFAYQTRSRSSDSQGLKRTAGFQAKPKAARINT
jgi:hypothetical protein